MKKKASKSRNANFSEEKLLLAELEKQYPYMSALKKKCHRWKKTWKVSKAEMPIVTSAIWRQFRDVGSAWNCKPKRNFDEQWRERKKTGGGKAPASPNAISKLVADGIPASGQQPCDWRHWWTRTKCPMQYAEYQLKPAQKTNSKAKEKSESIRCRVSEFAIFNYPLFYLFISWQSAK